MFMEIDWEYGQNSQNREGIDLYQVYTNDANVEGRSFDDTHKFIANDFYSKIQMLNYI